MSVYDFNNHHETHSNANHASHGISNGTQQSIRYQITHDYSSRGSPTANQPDLSNQLTRPTSRTAMLVRQRRAMLEQLSCYLCKGYLIDATTIDECMDSFCKSCIVIYLRSHNNCPKCGTLIHKTNPLSTIRSDKVLQDIVYKLVPGLYDDEMKRRREFYRGLLGLSSDDDDGDSSSSSYNGKSFNLTGEQYGVVSHPKPFYKSTDSIDISIEPQTRGDTSAIYYDKKRQSIVTCFTGNLQQRQHQPLNSLLYSTVDGQQFKTYLRCPARLTTLQLKKLIAAKFNLCSDDTIRVLYLNETLKDELSLIDIAYIYDWRGIEHMQLFYVIERNLTDTDSMQSLQVESKLRKPKIYQSVGTSTQTNKRVCIDPHPKFYEEQNNNSTSTHTSGRSMRPRHETCSQSQSTKVAANQLTIQAPMLRSYSLGRESSELRATESIVVGGVTKREVVAISGSKVGHSAHPTTCSTSINELARLNQTNLKDTRSSRKLTAESIPKININLNSLDQRHNPTEKNVNTYSKVKIDVSATQNEITGRSNVSNIRQLIPYVGNVYSTVSSFACPSQSSIVTLASFTEARNNHVVSMSASSATISGSYKSNDSNFASPFKQDTRMDSGNSPPNRKTSQSTLDAFKTFQTERGTTIVRRLNSQNELAAASNGSHTTIARANPVLALPAPSLQRGNQGSDNRSSNFSATSNHSSAGSSGGAQSNVNSSNSHDGGGSGRHHLKVKPVYKTFVDPTKLKSPNFKKLGYTARH